jgi:UDP-glucuronate decarboxylase
VKILIAGGAGFIGSNLSEYLLKKEISLIILDSFITGSRNNLNAIVNDPRVQIVEIDISKSLDLDLKVDGIINLASPASPIHYQKDPIYTFKSNVFGTYNLLNLALKNRCSFLQASTSEIYGDPLVTPQSETYWGNVNPVGVRSCYDESKRASESLIMDFYRKYNLDLKIMRLFNTYGPKMALEDGRVVSNFIVQALQNKPITIYGDGNQTRSFCFIDDILVGIDKLFFSNIAGDPINLGNPNEMTLNELVTEIGKFFEYELKVENNPALVDDPVRRKPDILLANTKLNWKPVVKLEEGLKLLINSL